MRKFIKSLFGFKNREVEKPAKSSVGSRSGVKIRVKVSEEKKASKKTSKKKDKLAIKSRPGYFDSAKPTILNPVLSERGILVVYFVKEASGIALGATLFDKKDPSKVLWRSANPLLEVGENIKPSKVEIRRNDLIVHFKSRSRKALKQAIFSLSWIFGAESVNLDLERFQANPILKLIPEHSWESQYVFNAAAIYLNDRVHLVYRAVGDGWSSVFGYAASKDGFRIDERLDYPIFAPSRHTDHVPAIRHNSYDFSSGGGIGGCEDPRITKVEGDNNLYMIYTVFDGSDCPRIALTSIKENDFLNKKWKWEKPVLISRPGETNKNWVMFPEKINGKYAILHSICPEISIAYLDNLDFKGDKYIESFYDKNGRKDCWDNWVRGAGPSPIRTKDGWLLFYHAMDYRDPGRYKLGAMILDYKDPSKILYRSAEPLLEPDEDYENEGFKAGVIYSCGAVVIKGQIFIYYGGADTVVCVATKNLDELLEGIKQSRPIRLNNMNPEKCDLCIHQS